MNRISRHKIDDVHVANLKPVPLKVNFYIDGYAAKLASAELFDIGDKGLDRHLRSQASLTEGEAQQLYDNLYAPPSPEVFAQLLEYSLAVIELAVISTVEGELRTRGNPMFPNALLVNKSNPINIDVDGVTTNLLEALYPVEEDELLPERFLDVSCDGIIYSTRKIDRAREPAILRSELERSDTSDVSRIEWLTKNIDSINDGVIYYRGRDGRPGNPVNFEFSERFFDAVADEIGYFSRLGQSKIHRRQGLKDFGEKGVD